MTFQMQLAEYINSSRESGVLYIDFVKSGILIDISGVTTVPGSHILDGVQSTFKLRDL